MGIRFCWRMGGFSHQVQQGALGPLKGQNLLNAINP